MLDQLYQLLVPLRHFLTIFHLSYPNLLPQALELLVELRLLVLQIRSLLHALEQLLVQPFHHVLIGYLQMAADLVLRSQQL